MKEFKILKFIDKFAAIFEKFGADYKMMRRILQIKLLMDGRRVPTVFQKNKKKEGKEDSNEFFKSLWIYSLMGIMIIPFVIMKSNYVVQMSITFGIIMFLIMTTLISDFSAVLLDIRDKNIIGTKPVSAQTLNLAKALHIIIYIFYITVALVGPALLVSLFVQGIFFFLLFIAELILIEMFIIVLTALLYFSIIKFFDGERLKDIINYFQIGLSITITVGYQLIGRLFSIVDMKINFVPKWWNYFIVPVWFSAPFQMLKKAEFNFYNITFAILSVVVPFISFVLYIKLLPVFEKNLQKLNNNSDNKGAKRKIGFDISKFICKSREERAFFRFTSNMIKNEREFKLKVYPMLGMSIVLPFIFIFQQMQERSLHQIGQGKTYLFIYFSALIIPNVVMMISFSEKYKAAWVYKVTPFNDYAPVLKGSLKAVLTKLVMPIYLSISIIFTILYGIRILPDLFTVFLIMMIVAVLCVIVNKKRLPFSEPFMTTQSGKNAVITIITMVILPLLAGIHLVLTFFSYGVYIYLGIALIVNFVLWKYALNSSIKRVKINLRGDSL